MGHIRPSPTSQGRPPLKRMPILAAALAALAIAIPASASTGAAATSEPTATATETPTETSTEPTWVPNTPLTNVYFLCDGETKEGTVNAAANNQYPSWSEDAPGSVTGGEGCGQVDDGFFGGIRPQTPFEFSAAGYYTGNLDTLTFSMYNIFVGQRRQAGASTVDISVLVDGESLFGLASTTNAAGTVTTEPAPKRIQLTPSGTTGAAALYEATIAGIDLLAEADNVEHEVVFNIHTTEPMNIWTWGASETPSGLTFNPAESKPVVLQAVPRDDRS